MRKFIIYCGAVILAWWPASASPQEAPAITVGDEPLVRIGTVSDGGPTSFFQVEDVLIAGGRIFVANRGSQEVRMFGASDGQFQGSVGGLGDGPGEYRWIRFIDECAPGEVTVFDPIQARVTTLAPDGATLATRTLPMLGDLMIYDLRCGFDGGYLAVFQGSGRVGIGQSYRPFVALAQISRSKDRAPRVLMRLLGDERYRWPGTDGPRVLGKKTVFGAWADRLVTGTGDAYRLTIHHGNAEPTYIELPGNRVPVEQAHIDFLMQRDIESSAKYGPSIQSAIERSYRETEYPRWLPPYGRLEVDAADRLWVQRYPIPKEVRTEYWDVYDRDARHLASIRMPDGFIPLWFGSDRFAGKRLDAMHVEYIEVYPIMLPPSEVH